ncbi:MAG TPA: CoA ester lyase [Polyangiaceae bacterium]|nr:CoA ester lyase [Polyangiaceae bacterium]
MTQNVRPRRSVLYMPGSNARAQEKAKSLAADGIIFDLEDATAPDAKEQARSTVAQSVSGGGYGSRELIVRVNGLDTPWGKLDVEAATKAAPDAILLPKVETADQVRELEALMRQNGVSDKTSIMCMMETPLGILNAKEIAAASKRISCLVMGTSDLTKDLHARHTQLRLPMLTSLGICLLAAHAYHLSILDGVYLDLNDAEGFRAACTQGLELGFDGKTLIHPSQVEPCNDVFSPSADEIAQAKKIILAHEEAKKAGKGVVLVDGKLIENLHVENANRLVAMMAAIERAKA